MRVDRLNTAKRIGLGSSILLASLLASHGAVAQQPPPPPPQDEAAKPKPASSQPPPPPLNVTRTSPKRALPDYDGVPEQTTALDVAIWVPKVLFFPVWVVTEFVIRRPLGALTSAVDRYQVISKLEDIFTFGPNNNIGIVPTALFDFGLRASVGVYSFYDDFLSPGNNLRLHAAIGGSDLGMVSIADVVPLDDRSHLRLGGNFLARPDWPFYGLGPRSLETERSRYKFTSIEGTVSFHGTITDAVTMHAIVGVKSVDFDADGSCCADPSLAQRVRDGELQTPPGFEGYTALRQELQVTIDSRKKGTPWGTGARLELNAQHDFNLRDPANSRWIRYGGTLGGFVDLTGHRRILALNVYTEFADPVGDQDQIPFTELVSIGGFEPMRGFLPNRGLDRSAAVATLEYRYPIWAFLDGSLQFSMGNVFGKHLEDFSGKLLRMSWDAGIRSNGDRDHAFNFLIGAGTETFEDGAHVNSLRLLIGGTRGF